MFKLRREHHTAAAPRQEQGQGPQVLNMCERPNWSALLVYYGNRTKLYIVSARRGPRRKRHTRRVRAGRDDGCRRPIAASAHRAAGHEGWMRIGAAREGARAFRGGG